MAEPITPPDLVSAGVAQQSQPTEPMPRTTLPQNTLSLLRPQPGMNDGASLMQALVAPQGAPSGGLAFGSGLLASLAGARSQNPYLDTHTQQMDTDYRRRADMVGFADRFQERARKIEEQRDAAAWEIAVSLKDSDNPRAQEVYAMEAARRAKRYGLNIAPESFVQAARLGKEEIEQINGDLVAGLTPEQIIARHPKLSRMSPTWLQDQTKILQNPAMRSKLGYKTDDEIRLDAETKELQHRKLTAEVFSKEHPELSGDANRMAAVEQKHLDLFDKPSTEGTHESRTKAYKAAIAEIQAREDERDQKKGEIILDRVLAGIQFRSQFGPPPKPVPIQIKQKMLELFSKSESIHKSIGMVEESIEEMDKIGALPSGNDVASQYAAKLYRTTRLRSHPAVVKFQQLWGPVSIGQIDRGLFDEKGVRAIAAFSKQLDAVDNIPTKEALVGYLSTVKQSLVRSMEARIEDLEALDNTPTDVLGRAQSIYQGLTGKGPARSGPLNPDKDPLGILGR